MPFKLSSFRQRAWKEWFLGWLPWAAYIVLVFEGAIKPASEIPQFLLRFNDKIIHGVEYFILFWITLNAFRRTGSCQLSKLLMRVLFFCAFMGVLTEVVQLWVPSRSAEVADFMADAAGFSLAALLFYRIRKNK